MATNPDANIFKSHIQNKHASCFVLLSILSINIIDAKFIEHKKKKKYEKNNNPDISLLLQTPK